MKFINYATEIPSIEHYALIESRSLSIPGDQRSIDCPGHGYPASTENFTKYIAFDTLDEITIYLYKYDASKRKSIKVLKVTPLVLQETLTLK